MRKTIFLSLLLITLFAGCKKKRTTDVVPANTETDNIALDESFGSHGALLLYNKKYSEFKISYNNNIFLMFYDINYAVTSFSKVNTNGSFDTYFGDWGRKNYNFRFDNYAILSNDEILAYGDSAKKIGIDGTLIPNYVEYKYYNNILPLSDGSRLVSLNDSLYMVNSDGTKNQSFLTTNIPSSKSINANNSFYIYNRNQKTLKRVFQGGGIDGSFGNSGEIKISDHVIQQIKTDLYKDKIYIYYSIQSASGGYDIKIMRYDLNGKPDMDFGNSGVVLVNAPVNTTYNIISLVATDFGNVYLYTMCYSSDVHPLVIKLKSNGLLDTDYGAAGINDISDLTYVYSAQLKDNNIYLLGVPTSDANSSTLIKYKIQ
jgi:hypothetical protein